MGARVRIGNHYLNEVPLVFHFHWSAIRLLRVVLDHLFQHGIFRVLTRPQIARFPSTRKLFWVHMSHVADSGSENDEDGLPQYNF